ncbi:MAG: HNH endonuclease [Clostridium baratii]|uniref:HNH endonuclease n=1 Tax=Clostridium baratii TaxID=1561 RepID=UPI00242ADD12|nr:HNH endonuclease [Clostridium baratii]MBS6006897.1 HNH endonuclease [Clostridium baratii]MDU1053427.1 HNH endonuclease [Clostridium baratii]
MYNFTENQILDELKISKDRLRKFKEKGLVKTISKNNICLYNKEEVSRAKEETDNLYKELVIGESYSNNKIQTLLGCSGQGGMRRSHLLNILVLFDDHSKSLYENEWVDNILHYTGMGTKGDQVLEGNQNKTLYNSTSTKIPVLLFETFKKGHHKYKGLVKVCTKPYQTNEPDINGDIRRVWKFPLKFESDPFIDDEDFKILEEKQLKEAQKLSPNELKKKAKASKGKCPRRSVKSEIYIRDQDVALYVKNRANGTCDLCNLPAPFTNSKGEPYLENHHVVWLSKGGPDTIYNCVALCPNCHRKMHILNSEEDISKLERKISEYND